MGGTPQNITAADWSLELDSTAPGAAAGAGLGNVVQGINDVAQCIAIILTTIPGSDPLRPTFGCDLWQYVDRPMNQALPKIVREVTDAILEWEPRVNLISVTAQMLSGGAGMTVTVTWQLKLTGATQTTQVTL